MYEIPEGAYYLCDGGRLTDICLDKVISSNDWMDICRQEGRFYIGGCCGPMSTAQDYLNDMFRFGGSVLNLSKFYDIMRHHDGYNEEDLPLCRDKAESDPLARLMLLYEEIRPYAHAQEDPSAQGAYQDDDPRAALRLVSRLSTGLEFDLLTGQGHMNRAWRAMVIGSMLPALGTLHRHLADLHVDFEGFVIVGPDGPEMTQGGPAIFEDERRANEIAQKWGEEYTVLPGVATLDGLKLKDVDGALNRRGL